jgi:hypothetical protein
VYLVGVNKEVFDNMRMNGMEYFITIPHTLVMHIPFTMRQTGVGAEPQNGGTESNTELEHK